jgi:hypothetical protein
VRVLSPRARVTIPPLPAPSTHRRPRCQKRTHASTNPHSVAALLTYRDVNPERLASQPNRAQLCGVEIPARIEQPS